MTSGVFLLSALIDGEGGGSTICGLGMDGLSTGVSCFDACFWGGVGSSASVFFCGWAISGFLACAVLVVVWGRFVSFLHMPLF